MGVGVDLLHAGGRDVEDEPADVLPVGNPGTTPDGLDGAAHPGVDVGEAGYVPARHLAGLGRQPGAERLVVEALHAALGVVDQHDLAGTEVPLAQRE
jgi:hypothetical protein